MVLDLEKLSDNGSYYHNWCIKRWVLCTFYPFLSKLWHIIGIGAVIADTLLKNKETKIVAVARSEEPLNNLKIKYGEERVATVAGDLSDSSVSKQVIDLAVEKFGQIDSIIANAGVLHPVAQIKDAKIDEWKKLFDVNFFSIVTLVSQALPYLRESKGNVVLVSSGASTKAYVS